MGFLSSKKTKKYENKLYFQVCQYNKRKKEKTIEKKAVVCYEKEIHTLREIEAAIRIIQFLVRKTIKY